MKLEPLQYRSESPVQGMSDRQQESRGSNPVRKSNAVLILLFIWYTGIVHTIKLK